MTFEREVCYLTADRGSALARDLREALDLRLAVVGEVGRSEDRRGAAIRAAAQYLDAKSPSRIAVGWGLSLRSLPSAVPSRPTRSVEVYEIIGRAAWWAPEDGPFDISAALAGRYRGRAWPVPAPAFAASPKAARGYLASPGVVEVLARAATADLVLVGPSAADPDTSSLVLAGGLTREEMTEMRARGAVGDIVGQFYDEAGHALSTELDARTVRLSLEQLRAANVVAIATGTERVRSISGAVRGGLIRGLITDERTAIELIAASPPTKT